MLVVVRNHHLHHILQKWNIATFIWLKSIYMKESTQDSRALEFCPIGPMTNQNANKANSNPSL